MENKNLIDAQKNKPTQNNRQLLTAPQQVQKHIQSQNILQVQLHQTFTTSIATYKKNKELFTLYILAISKEINNLAEFFQIKERLSQENIVKFILLAIEKYPDLTYEDFLMFIKTMMIGNIQSPQKSYKYPKVYDKIHGALLLEAIQIYYEAKVDQREALIQQNKQIQEKKNQQTLQFLKKYIEDPKSLEQLEQERVIDKINQILEKISNANHATTPTDPNPTDPNPTDPNLTYPNPNK
jgi:hypothetical protein